MLASDRRVWVRATVVGKADRGQESLMLFLPIIANPLGKIAAAAATTLGVMGFFDRERIGRWFAATVNSTLAAP